MSEQRGQYAASGCTTSAEPLTCECGRCIGEVVIVEASGIGVPFLTIGGVHLRAASGTCAGCGREFHWTVPDRQFARMMAAIRQMHAAT